MSPVVVEDRKTISKKGIRAALVVSSLIAVAFYLQSNFPMVSYVRDDWQFLNTRQSLAWSDLIARHNGHWVLTPQVILLLWFKTVGLAHHGLYSALGMSWHLAAIIAASVVVARRLGFVPAYVCGLFLAMSSTGFEVWSWGAGFGFSGSIFFGVVGVYCFDKFVDEGGIRWRVLLMFALLLSLSTQGAGVPLVLVVAAVAMMSRQRRQVWWAVAIPVCLYLSIYAYWQVSNDIANAYVPIDPGWTIRARYLADGMAWSFASPLGLGLRWGYGLTTALGVLAVVAVVRDGLKIRRFLWPAAFVGFWALLAWQRGFWFQPQTSRYLWCGMMLAVLSVVELLPQFSLPRFVKIPVSVGAVVTVAVVSVVTLNNAEVGFAFYHDDSVTNKMTDSVAIRTRDRIAPAVTVHQFWNTSLITADPYFRAVDMYGRPPMFSLEQMSLPGYRDLADASLSRLGLLTTVLTPSQEPCVDTALVPSVQVEPGTTQRVRVWRKLTAVVTRFLDPGSATTFNVADVSPGVWEVKLPHDELGRPTTVTFGGDIVGICGEN